MGRLSFHDAPEQQPEPQRRRLDFKGINAAALPALPELLSRWLPAGTRQGHEYVALNPKRADHHLGSLKVNLRTGKWSDFAVGAAGGDVISLAAYLFDLKQGQAARHLAKQLGVRTDA